MANRTDSSRQKPYTLGFLSEVPTFATEALLFQGAKEEAERLGVNMIYFTPLIDEGEALHFAVMDEDLQRHIRSKHDELKAYLDGFQLDGLVFVGWSRDFDGEQGQYLREQLKSMKLLSLGKVFEDTPSIIMDGGPYVYELAKHLANDHGCRHIAYVNPWSEDARVDHYIAAMEECNQFNEQLIIRTDELAGYKTQPGRMRHAIKLLLDQRDTPVDAIMVMSAFEGKFILDELLKRGLRVPEDIALVCYENSPVIEYAKPSLTTIYYPYIELGAAACRNLVAQLDGEEIADITSIPTNIIYRDSCGCTINRIKPVSTMERSLEQNRTLMKPVSMIEVASQMHLDYPLEPFDYARIVDAFQTSIETMDGTFLHVFGQEMDKVRSWGECSLQGMIDRLRELLLPLFGVEQSMFERGETLWVAARYIAKDYETAATLAKYLRYEEQSRIINKLNQHLLSARSVLEVRDILTGYLEWLQIPTLYLFLDGISYRNDQGNHLLLAYDDHRIRTDLYRTESDLAGIFHTFLAQRNHSFTSVVMPLLANEEQLGIAWMDPGIHDTNLIVAMIGLISNALKSALLMEESRSLVEQLSAEIVLRREKEAQLAFYADMDYLTHLYNRRYFYEALSTVANERKSFAVCYLDIDGFKQINDTLGHDAGDKLLVQIADRLREILSEGALVMTQTGYNLPTVFPANPSGKASAIFRIGGDEFTALLRATDPDEVIPYAERLVEAIHRPFELPGGDAQVSVSIGISMYPADTPDIEHLLQCADLALYKAKKTKGSYFFYNNTTSP